MSTINAIHAQIAEAEETLKMAEQEFTSAEEEYTNAEETLKMAKKRFALAEGTEISARQALYSLNIALQTEEAAVTAEAAVAALRRPVGTKYKWTHKNNPETYRVAIQTKEGVLQVKSVTDGVAEFHEDCDCTPCHEFDTNAPWRPRKPLKQRFFADLAAWDDTLPENQGRLVITSAPITDKALKALCMKPLEATWESGQLEELQERFPGGVFVLSSRSTGKQIEIKAYGMAIYCVNPSIVCSTFKHFFNEDKVQLMVEWRGLYIDLSHLF